MMLMQLASVASISIVGALHLLFGASGLFAAPWSRRAPCTSRKPTQGRVRERCERRKSGSGLDNAELARNLPSSPKCNCNMIRVFM